MRPNACGTRGTFLFIYVCLIYTMCTTRAIKYHHLIYTWDDIHLLFSGVVLQEYCWAADPYWCGVGTLSTVRDEMTRTTDVVRILKCSQGTMG